MSEASADKSQQPIRWGILATGWIAERFTQDLMLAPDAEVVAVGSRSEPAAKAFADRFGIPRAYGSWVELAADDDVDVVYVATPHSAHHAATRLCLTAGKAVLCEKPFTLDAASAQDLIRTAREHDVFLMEAMWTRCNPLIRRVLDLVADGALGEVTTVSADFGVPGPLPPTHRLRDPALGGGALLDLGVYPVTLAHLALGRPDSITAQAALTPEGVDENTTMIFRYASGAFASLTCGLVGLTGTRGVIAGHRGRIELADPFFVPPQATLHRTGSEPEVLSEPLAGNGFLPEIGEVHRCLRAGLRESPLVSHAVSVEVMSILDDVRARIGVSYPVTTA